MRDRSKGYSRLPDALKGRSGQEGGCSNHQAALSTELGEAHQQGLPRRLACLPPVRGKLKVLAHLSDEISVKRILTT